MQGWWMAVDSPGPRLGHNPVDDGWEWWDFCADAPKNAGYNPEFEVAWQRIWREASQKCCVCNPMPKKSKTSKIYKLAYSWPLILQDSTIHDVCARLSCPLHSDKLESAFCKINPQIRNFWINYELSMMLFYTEKAYGCNVLPPLAWDIDDMGRTVLPSCGRLANGFLEWISVSYFPAIRTKKLIVSNLACTESQFYERRGSCDLCHLNSVSHCGSTSGEECCVTKDSFTTLTSNVQFALLERSRTQSQVSMCACHARMDTAQKVVPPAR